VGVGLEGDERVGGVGVARAARRGVGGAAIDRGDRERQVDAQQEIAAAGIVAERAALGVAVGGVGDRRARTAREARLAARALGECALADRAVEAVGVAACARDRGGVGEGWAGAAVVDRLRR